MPVYAPDEWAGALASLRALDPPVDEVVLVDNGGVVPAEAPVRVVRPGRNLGFGEGVNRGARAASACDWFLVLNDDVRLPRDFLERMRSTLQRPEVGVAGTAVVYEGDPGRAWSLGGAWHRVGGFAWSPGKDGPVPEGGPERVVDYAPACAVLIRASAFAALGGFDPGYFLYFEDLDLCWRVRERGLLTVVRTDVRVHHAVSAGSGGDAPGVPSPARAYCFGRNPFLFVARHGRGWRRAAWWAGQFLIRLPYRVLRMARAGAWDRVGWYLRGVWDGLAGRFGALPEGVL